MNLIKLLLLITYAVKSLTYYYTSVLEIDE